MEKEKIILRGFGSLHPPSLTPSHSLYPSLISPILSGDFQRETVKIKDLSSSDVSATCHMSRKNIPTGFRSEMQTLQPVMRQDKDTRAAASLWGCL